MKRIFLLGSLLGASLICYPLAAADKPVDPRINPATIKAALDFADNNKDFAAESALYLDNAPPRGIGDADPVAVAEIIAMELDMLKAYNTEFLTDPAALLRFWINSPDRLMFDIATPGEYYGSEMDTLFKWGGPQMIGRLEFKEMKVYARSDIGYVTMKENYYGQTLDGKPVHIILRQTDVVRKENGTWRIMHSHVSFPIDFATGMGDLKSAKRPLPWDVPTPAAEPKPAAGGAHR